MAKAKHKSPAANVSVPQDRDQAAAVVRAIGQRQRDIAAIERKMNDRIAAIKETAEAAAAPLRAEIAAMTKGLQIWCEANREAITQANKVKFADLGTGEVKWRSASPSVEIKSPKDVIARLKALGLQRFIRVTEAVDREAMLREPEVAGAVPGVTIRSKGEDFSVEPFEIELSGAPA